MISVSEQSSPSDRAMVIAIDGAAGSGKTTLAAAVAGYLEADIATQIIHTDHYFEPAGNPGVSSVAGTPGGFNVVRFMDQVGAPINNTAVPFRVQEYQWETGTYVDLAEPDRKQSIIVEGIKLIGLPINWDLAIWINTSLEERRHRFLARRIEDRRMKESDRETLLARFDLWAADAAAYEAEISPHERDDIIVVEGTDPANKQLEIIWRAIEKSQLHATD